uniref:Achaete scute target 1 n=1 Tax=Ditylenchus dipsaci TaxID=166011 RepID=A0A915ERP6_9BILA
MFSSWLKSIPSQKKAIEDAAGGLRQIYKQKLFPLEAQYNFHEFHSPALDDGYFEAKPMVMLVGQYSTGKTSLIRYLLGQDFPGIRIGPEPTTDRFIAVMHDKVEGTIPGNALVVDSRKQFRALTKFGNTFLNRFQCSALDNQVLETLSFIDTPGILSGEKQRTDRGYDFVGVLEWFSEHTDRIILLFDAHKLDISDEFKRCIQALSGNEEKIRIVLNKADMVDPQQLMRIYGSLMWSLGKIFKTPEVVRVFTGSFWNQPLQHDTNRKLFLDEQNDLFADLQSLPRNSALRKLNDLIKRARLAKAHAYKLDSIFYEIQRKHGISAGDFPDVEKMRESLKNADFSKFSRLKLSLLDEVDEMLSLDIAHLMSQISLNVPCPSGQSSHDFMQSIHGGAFGMAAEGSTPFGTGKSEAYDRGANEHEWIVEKCRQSSDELFESMVDSTVGKIPGRIAKEHMVKSKLPNSELSKIWTLADVDKDGYLDYDEFALANYLIEIRLTSGADVPNKLPEHLVPPAKRAK